MRFWERFILGHTRVDLGTPPLLWAPASAIPGPGKNYLK
jgi:hypothetical protein